MFNINLEGKKVFIQSWGINKPAEAVKQVISALDFLGAGVIYISSPLQRMRDRKIDLQELLDSDFYLKWPDAESILDCVTNITDICVLPEDVVMRMVAYKSLDGWMPESDNTRRALIKMNRLLEEGGE